MSAPEGVLRLAAVAEGRSGSHEFATNPSAEPGTFEWHLHRARLALEVRRGRGSSTEPRVKFKSAAELIQSPPRPMHWVIAGVIPERAVYGIAGAPKGAKTWVECDFALAVANARPALSEFLVTEAGDVAMFLLEDAEQSLRTRLAAVARGMGLDPTAAAQRIHYQCRGSIDLRRDEDVCAIIAAVWMLGRAVKVVFIDPLRDAHGAEENSSTEMRPVMHQLRAIRDILECAVIFVHHTSKPGEGKGKRRAPETMRGSTAIHGAVDGGLYLALREHTQCQWVNDVLVETKTGRAAGAFRLTLDVEDDANGEADRASWTFSRGGDAQAATGARKQAILDALTERPDSGTGLVERLGSRRGDVFALLAELGREGRIYQRGHRWHPAEKSIPTVPAVPRDSPSQPSPPP